jgi:transposase
MFRSTFLDRPLERITDPNRRNYAIFRLRFGGESVKKVAEVCGVPQWLVRRWLKKFDETPEFAVRITPREQLPLPEVTPEEVRELLEVVRSNPGISIWGVMALSNYPSGGWAARRLVNEMKIANRDKREE